MDDKPLIFKAEEIFTDIPGDDKNINMKIITWCDNNCSGKFGWYFDDVVSGQRLDHTVTRKTIFTFEKKYDCFNFKLKQL